MTDSVINKNLGIFPSRLTNLAKLIFLPIFAMSVGAIAYLNPPYRELIVTLNLWLLGYHHVLSTYSRIGFDVKSMKENWFFVFVLPIIVLVSVYFVYQYGGPIWIGSIYLYWQWYHYSRQSEGVSKAFGMKSENKAILNQAPHRFLFYIVPILSLLLMSSRGGQTFFGTAFFQLTILSSIRPALMALLVFALAVIVYRLYQLHRTKQITTYYVIYLLGHYSIYVFSYVLIDDITSGWLAINIWHNAQYIGIVWLFNRNRYKAGTDKSHLLISYLSQPKRVLMYFLFFITLTFIFYGLVNNAVDYFAGLNGLPMLLIVYSTINFHHYVVDSQIWKLRKKSVSQNLS